MTLRLAGLLALLLLAADLGAQAEPDKNPLPNKVETLRRSILGESREITVSVLGPAADEAGREKRGRFKKALMELLAVHGPKGSGPRLDCLAVYRALAGADAGLEAAELRELADRLLADDPGNAGLVAVLERIGPDLGGGAMISISTMETGALVLATPEFDEVAPALLAWALRQRGGQEGGLAAHALDLLLARCAAAFGSVAEARRIATAIESRPGLEGEAGAALRLAAGGLLATLQGLPERSTWPDSPRERQGFRRLWQGLLDEDLRLATEGQRAALAAMGRVMAAVPGLLARARGEEGVAAEGLKDDEGGRLLGDFVGHSPGTNDAWAKRLAALKRASGEERLAAIDLVFDFGLVDAELIEPLSDFARTSRDWELRAMALRAMAFQRATELDRRLVRLGDDKVWQVRLAAAEALGAFRAREAVDALLGLLDDEHLRVRAAAARSLADLTGVALGTSKKRWQTWLAEKGEGFELPDRAAARAMRAGSPDDERYARYFDLVIPSNRVAFVLDKSESMYWGLWDGAVGQVASFLEESGPTTFFGLVEYDADARVFKKGLMAANAANTKKALSFLTRSRPTGATNIIDALKAAFEFNDCDAVVLLSDGLPNKGKPSAPEGIIDAMERLNRHQRLAIHTVQMLPGRVIPHDAPEDAARAPLPPEESARRDELRRQAGSDELGGFLKKLARLNEGHYGLGFGDIRQPPPGTRFGPGTDR